jgi:hypothetical protein
MDGVPQTYQGQRIGSVNEWWVLQALLSYGHTDLSYQYPLDGGRDRRSGQVVDIVDWAPPQATAIYVQGQRWHSGRFGREDDLKLARAERLGFRVVEIAEAECETLEAARAAVQRKVL